MDEHEVAALVARFYGALAAGDRDALDVVLAEDFSGRFATGMPLGIGGREHDRTSMREHGWWTIGRHFAVTPEPADIVVGSGGRVAVTGTYRGSARRGGPVEAAYVHVLQVEGGRIRRLEQVTDTAAWRDALGSPLATIDLEVADGVAVVRLDRPEVRNAIDLRLAQEWLVVVERIVADPAVRAVLVCGAGSDLTVGGDIAYFGGVAAEDLPDLLARMVTPFHEGFSRLARHGVPVVTAAQGSTAGGGLGFVYAADVVLAAPDARFVTAFGALGLSGDGGSSWHLPRRIGALRAAQVLLENRPISAEEGLAWGLVSEIVPADRLQDVALERARRLAAGPTRAHASMRALLRDAWTRSQSDHLREEIDQLRLTAATRDAQGAIAAFRLKQRPTFEGA
ncbi:enoyl-CoA hydratase-related protein [Nocardioides zeae]|uniref:DUF4440 domain-containing protein n=1 Tax=Nocardioides zeae TaxID=1457234 RepID=A0A6P0HG57_9ACTN|nr:enoyl-CoA hydratase-related protein [Nocardioides zeae]NEN77613.1 DUF4440 domain-containing protein [Nocardioides zeae]